jgi:autotransporter-associated beta strand protein
MTPPAGLPLPPAALNASAPDFFLRTTMRLPYFLLASLTLACTIPCHAQKLFTSGDGFLTPSFRGIVGTTDDYTHWDIFEDTNADGLAFNELFLGDLSAGNSGATINQTKTDTAFFTSGFNIYSFSQPTGFVLANTRTAHPNNVVFQFETLGSFFDYDSIKLNYISGGNTISLSPTNFINEYRVITGGFGGFTNRASLQWDLTGLSFTSYTITFASTGSSNSFNVGILDTSTAAYTEVVPSARVWDGGGGNALWSNGNNWSQNTVQPSGGNITFDASAPAAISLNTAQQIGQLDISKSGSFALSGNSTLTINSGIEVTATGTTASISAPIFLGGHNFLHVASGSSLTLSGAISGAAALDTFPAAGIYKTGAGELALTTNNTFAGGVTLDGGTLRIAANNTNSGATSVLSGKLLLQVNALNGSGALGNATSNIAFGSGGTFGLPAAEIILEGDRTMARHINPTAGGDTKRLGVVNSSSGALFSGNVSLNTTTDNLYFTAIAATDKVSFSGTIAGGQITSQIMLDGLGEVIYSGVNKTYLPATILQSGTLRIASGTNHTGSGNYTVQSGAKLLVDGSLEGTGGTATLTLTGGLLGGSGTVKRAIGLDGGDTLSPGNNVGTLSTTVGATFGPGGRYLFEIHDVNAGAGTGWDTFNIIGALNITANNTNPFVIDVDSLTLTNTAGLVHDFNALNTYDWTLLTATSITGFNTTDFAIDLANFGNSYSGAFSVLQSGNSIVLHYANVVPEPSRILLLFGGLTSLLLRRKHNSNCKGFVAKEQRSSL